MVLRGKVNRKLCPYLYVASLVVLQMPSEGMGPIAVRSTISRLAAKVVSARNQDKMMTLSRPAVWSHLKEQTPQCTLLELLEKRSMNESCQCFLELDFLRAFDFINRDEFLQAAQSKVREYFAFVWQNYRNPLSSRFWQTRFRICTENAAK